MAFIQKNNEYLIAASSGGSAQNPTWFSNLERKPEATVELNGKQIKVNVVITSGHERDQLYALFKATYPGFTMAEKRVTRKIPVIRLQPIMPES